MRESGGGTQRRAATGEAKQMRRRESDRNRYGIECEKTSMETARLEKDRVIIYQQSGSARMCRRIGHVSSKIDSKCESHGTKNCYKKNDTSRCYESTKRVSRAATLRSGEVIVSMKCIQTQWSFFEIVWPIIWCKLASLRLEKGSLYDSAYHRFCVIKREKRRAKVH